jgi:gamma-glutamyltranspeptidase/glutathione hydrolase
VAIPGTPAGLEYALRKYGTLPEVRVIAPALRLASDGFILQQEDVDILSSVTEQFRQQPNVAQTFLKYGQPYRVGQRLKQPDLAQTLTRLILFGSDGFYRGSIADRIVAASHVNGGILQ